MTDSPAERVTQAYNHAIQLLSDFDNQKNTDALQKLCQHFFDDKSYTEQEKRNAQFVKLQKKFIENLFESQLDLWVALNDNNHVLTFLRENLAGTQIQRDAINAALDISNTFIESCEENIETIKEEDDDFLLTNDLSTGQSRIHKLYNDIFVDYTYTEQKPSLPNKGINLKLLEDNCYEISRCINDVIDKHTTLSLLKIAYYHSSYQDGEQPLMPLSKAERDKATSKQQFEFCREFIRHDLIQGKSAVDCSNGILMAILSVTNTFFPKKSQQQKPKLS